MAPRDFSSVGLVGYGAIGSSVGRALIAGEISDLKLAGVCDPFVTLPESDGDAKNMTLEELIQRKPKIIVESAGHSALRECIQPILAAGIDLLIVSVGALCDSDIYIGLEAAAKTSSSRVMITTGAIGGLDIIEAAKLSGKIKRASLTSIKPPQNLLVDGLPLKTKQALIKGEKQVEVFSGSVQAAALLFPKSANVCATLGFATLGIQDSQAVLIADPAAQQVIHKVHIESDIGEYDFTFQNHPSPQNPKTSAIVAYSILRGLRNWSQLAGETDFLQII